MHTVEGEASDADGHDHGEGDAQMVPISRVVSRPDWTDALRSSKESAAEDKGPVPIRAKDCLATLHQPLLVGTCPLSSILHPRWSQ